MKNFSIRVRIIPTGVHEGELNAKESFWKFVSEKIKKEVESPEKLENVFKTNFPDKIKQRLTGKFRKNFTDINNFYHETYDAFTRSLFFDKINRRKIDEINEDKFFNFLIESQRFKGETFGNNKIFQEVLTKYSLSEGIEFSVENISYSSLNFDLGLAPAGKAIELFDKHFDLFCIFFEKYIPICFLESIGASDGLLPISASFEYSQELKSEFDKTDERKSNSLVYQSLAGPNGDGEFKENSRNIAKWAWKISNFSLVLPVLLGIILLYFAYSFINQVESNRQKNYKYIFQRQDTIMDEYQHLIEYQRKVYEGIIEQYHSSDTTIKANKNN